MSLHAAVLNDQRTVPVECWHHDHAAILSRDTVTQILNSERLALPTLMPTIMRSGPLIKAYFSVTKTLEYALGSGSDNLGIRGSILGSSIINLGISKEIAGNNEWTPFPPTAVPDLEVRLDTLRGGVCDYS